MDRWIRIAAVAVAALVVGGIVFALTIGRGGLSTAGSGGGADVAATGPAAPEFAGIVGWDNSGPLTMAGLRGKVVLVDFWTYSCINCQRTLPYLRQWWDKYKGDGLVIVGVHSPEFEFEKDPANVKKAVAEYKVTWPVALDSNMSTWSAFQNQYWPAEYLIDRQGRVRHTHFGEGEYDVTERAIQQLLSEGGAKITDPLASADPGIGPDAANQTEETYAGSERGSGAIKLHGSWVQKPEWAEHVAAAATPGQDYAEIQYQARRVFLVAGSSGAPVTVRVLLDGKDLTTVTVGAHDLYPLVSTAASERHTLRLVVDTPGFELYTFTFGS